MRLRVGMWRALFRPPGAEDFYKTGILKGGVFVLLAILPVYERVRKLLWMKAALKGIGPAVIGMLTVSLTQMAPHAVPDYFAMAIFAFTVLALVAWRIGAIKVMLGGAVAGVLRDRLA